MRIAIFADIHSNREAFSACLEHAEGRQIDRYAFLGDMIGYGADPAWVLDNIIPYAERGAIVLLGNHEDMVLKGSHSMAHADAQTAIIWTRKRLTPSHMNFLAHLPLKVEESDKLFVHANPWAPDQWEYISAVFEAQKGFAATRARFVFFGHVHEPALYHQGAGGRVEAFSPIPGVAVPFGARRWMINPGAVGQPRDGVPAACYAIYDSVRATVTYHRIPFDVTTAAQKILDAGLPKWFGTRLDNGQ